MRWSVAAPIALLMLMSTVVPTAIIEAEELSDSTFQAGPKALACPATNVVILPQMVNLADQACLQVSLGALAPGSLVSIDASVVGNSADVLIFAMNSVGTYLNDQSYRNPSIWEGDASVESLSGDAEWHWEVPTDRQETDWFLILDNLAHAGDDGEGGQGGAESNITISVTFPTMTYWALMDSLQVLSPGSHVALLGPESLTLDTGTQISITALPLSGAGDLFILTESQKDTYLMGGGGGFWVPGTQMLSISTATTQPWIVTSDLGGQPLYLFLDNEAGPTGGGDGLSELKITVSVTLLPVLTPTISSADDLQSVDVGETVGFNVNSTPNLSNQVDFSLTEWDFDGDGFTDATGATTTTSFSSPDNFTVQATIHGSDGRNSTDSISVAVADSTNPTASILGSDVWQRDVDANFTLTSTSLDNWQISREDWRVDGSLISSFTSGQSAFTHSLNATGNHTVELTVVDGANNVATTTVTVVIRDGTKPVVENIVAATSSIQGESVTFTISASDPESSTLLYTWDFDKEVDSDLDGVTGNDAQATGTSVSWTFSSAKPTYVTCTVTNDANLSKTVQHLIDIEVDPAAASGLSSAFSSIVPFLIILLLAVLGGGGWLAWNWRKKNLANEALALQQATVVEDSEQPEPEREDQLSMYAPASSQSYGGDSIASLAGADYTQGTVSMDVLSAFVDDDDELVPSGNKGAVLDDLDFLRKREQKPEPTAEQKPVEQSVNEQGKVAKRSAGIALPGEAGVTQPASSPAATQQISAVAEPEPEPEPAPDSEVEEVTTVKASCPSCEQMFAVDIPHSIDEALVACPMCEQRIRLQR